MPNPIDRTKIFSTSKDPHGRLMLHIHCNTCGLTLERALSRPNMPPNIALKWFAAVGWAANKRMTEASCPKCCGSRKTEASGRPALAVHTELTESPVVTRPADLQPSIDEQEILGDVPTRVVTITPELALTWLEQNTRNRPLRTNYISELADEITAGRWRLNGETIKRATDGTILDGQHRLHAIFESGCTVQSLVATELDPDVFDTIDIGRKRTPGDALAVDGEKSATQLAAGAAALHAVLLGQTTRRRLRAPVREVMMQHPGLRDSVNPVHRCGKVFASRGSAVAAHYLLGKVDAEARDEMFSKLATGLGFVEGDPVYHLRERLMARGTNYSGKDSPFKVVAMIMHTWELSARGRKISRFQSTKRSTSDVIAEFLEAHNLVG